MTRERTESRTDANLLVALAGEADANRRYLAYGIQALNEDRPDIAQLFFEAAGAETIHALNHLRTMGAIGTTRENLQRAATGEMEEIEVVLPRMIHDAEAETRADAAASFRLALERERHHRDMFRAALASFDVVPPARGERATPAVTTPRFAAGATAADPARLAPGEPARPTTGDHALSVARSAVPPGQTARGLSELTTEAPRIERLSSIREVVFGAQDGLVSTFAVVAGLAAAGVGSVVVFLGGLVSATAGVLSMSMGTFLASRAQRQLYESELERERREIREHPGEEVAELMASLVARGMPRADAVEVARRIARHPELLLNTLAIFELGLAPQRLGTPIRDAFVMAVAFGVASLVPVAPFLLGHVLPALALSGALTLLALFGVGVVKARVAGVSAIRSGLEVTALAAASGLLSFGLGRLASQILGVDLS
ncbi:MAG TPA: VIT1/CCC1 transporter family protein [Methylomirabilota bacterium]|nr:VIT1/CCC1 transporter family protein [Methylomirabilota bacterium]